MTELSRRALLAAPALSAACATTAETVSPPAGADPAALAQDHAYWARVSALYDVPPEVLQLENGYWGVMARPVRAAFAAHTEMANTQGAYYARRQYGADLRALGADVAALLGAAPEEVAITRNATEALFALIGGYNKLRPGDAVMYADLDYDSAIEGMDWLRQRRGVDVIKIDLPHPATREGLIDAYDAALRANPRARLMLLTHVSHRTGLVPPVREIVALARARSVDCIVDSAHAIGQLDFTMPQLGADFAAFNLHKWIGAPIGVGAMYIRRERIPDIDPAMTGRASAEIGARVHTGTANFGAQLAARDAINLHNSIGIANKAARLRWLRDAWAERLRANPNVEIMTPPDPGMAGAITSFRLHDATSNEANQALAQRLLDEFRIFTVIRRDTATGACVRVTPALLTSPADIDRFVAAVETIAAGHSPG